MARLLATSHTYRCAQRGLAARRARGFTLLELLVVLAIVVIMVAMTIPGLGQLRSARQQVACAATLRNVGAAAFTYASSSYGRLPTHAGDPLLPFDTFMMNQPAGDAVNLGLLVDQVRTPEGFYCPTQTQETSPALAFDTGENKWSQPLKKLLKLPPQLQPATQPQPSVAQVNSSFAARSRAHSSGVQADWNIRNYANKVIYSDFAGVHGWEGAGRFAGTAIHAPHEATGYNRLFGNGSVQWVLAEALDPYRPVSTTVPTAKQMHDYYQLLDVLP